MKNKLYAILQCSAGVIAIVAVVVMWNELEGHYIVPYGLDFFMNIPFCQTRLLVPLGGILFIVTAPLTWRGETANDDGAGAPSPNQPDENQMKW